MTTEDQHIDRIAEAGARWEGAVHDYIRTWGRPPADSHIPDSEWRAQEAERSARSAYESARDEYRQHLRGEPHGD